MACSQELLSQINEDYLTCKICMDSFTEPKVLSCQHSFCRECLESCEKTANGSYLLCPVCRQRTLLGMKGVSGLKNNFVFSSIIDMLATWKKSKNTYDRNKNDEYIMCATCPRMEETLATFHCLDCMDPLCADCAAFHSRTKLTKDHEVITLEEMENGKYESKIRNSKMSFCSQHPNEKMDQFCKDCDVLVCRDCIIAQHQGHLLVEMEESIAEQKEKVNCILQDLEKHTKAIKNLQKDLQQKDREELEIFTQTEAEINKIAADIIQAVTEKKAGLIKKLENTHAENRRNFVSYKEELDTHLNCIDNCKQFSTFILEDTVCPLEIVSLRKQMEETTQQLHNKEEETIAKTKFLKFKKLRFIPSMKAIPNEIGKIEVDEEVENSDETKTKSVEKYVDLPPEKSKNQKVKKPLPTPLEKSKSVQNLDEKVKNPHPIPFPKPQPRTCRVKGKFDKETAIVSPVQTVRPRKRISEIFPTDMPAPSQRQSILMLTKNISEELSQRHKLNEKNVSSLSINSEPVNETIEQQHLQKPLQSLPTSPLPPRRAAPVPPTKPKPVNKVPPKTPKKPPKNVVQEQMPMTMAELYVTFGRKGKIITSGEMSGPPRSIAMMGQKNKILVLDSENNHVMVYSEDGWYKKSFKIALPDTNAQGLYKAVAITTTIMKSVIILYKKCVAEWSWDGSLLNTWGKNDLKDAHGVTCDNNNRIIVSDQERHMVFVYDLKSAQKIIQFGGFGENNSQFKSPRYVCTNSRNNIFVSDHHNHCIKVFNSKGKFLYKFGDKGNGPGQMRYPESIALLKPKLSEQYADGILVADEGNSRLSLFSSNGQFINHVLTKNEDKKLKSPQCLAVSKTTCNRLVVTQTNNISINIFKLCQFKDLTE